jgi:hypothetical protein
LFHNALSGSGQTRLNSGVTELLLPTAFAVWRRRPHHLWVKPDRQRSAPLQTVIVRRPILGLIFGRGPAAHPLQLSRWIHTVNPINLFVKQSRAPCNAESESQTHEIEQKLMGVLPKYLGRLRLSLKRMYRRARASAARHSAI